MQQPAPKEKIAARHAIRHMIGIFQRQANTLRQRRGDALINVEAQNPIILGDAHRKLFLPAESQPLVLDDARASDFGDGARLISAARIDHQNFGSELNTLQARLDLPRGIKRNNHYRDRNLGSGGKLHVKIFL